MKFRSREINVFSMSALDLFASALGAFILISIVLMPYFLRIDNEEVVALRAELSEAEAARNSLQASLEEERVSLRECRARELSCRQELEVASRNAEGLRSCQAQLNACKEKLSKTFLAVVIQWATKEHDVDLHVIDPEGEEFYYQRKTIIGRPGELSADTINGPGVEIWEVPEAPTGKFRVLYNLYSLNGNERAAVVKGGVYHRDGHFRFRERSLRIVGAATRNWLRKSRWATTAASRYRSASTASPSRSGFPTD